MAFGIAMSLHRLSNMLMIPAPMLFMSLRMQLREGAKHNADKAFHSACIEALSETFLQESLRAVTYRIL
jgi:hypothetical protein